MVKNNMKWSVFAVSAISGHEGARRPYMWDQNQNLFIVPPHNQSGYVWLITGQSAMYWAVRQAPQILLGIICCVCRENPISDVLVCWWKAGTEIETIRERAQLQVMQSIARWDLWVPRLFCLVRHFTWDCGMVPASDMKSESWELTGER